MIVGKKPVAMDRLKKSVAQIHDANPDLQQLMLFERKITNIKVNH
jgi:hypothetical protein